MLKKWGVFLATIFFILTSCQSPVYNQAEANVADARIKTANARAKSDNSGRPKPALIIKEGPYVDTSPISLEKDPSWLHNHIVVRGDSLPFSYYSRTVATGAGSNVLTKYQTGLDPALLISLNYSGSVRGALDMIAAKTGYIYSIHHNKIYWQMYVTKTFDIAFMPGGTDYLMGKASGTSAQQSSGGIAGNNTANYSTSDSSDSEFSSLKGSLSIWRDLNFTIKEMLSDGGSVVVSEATSSVTVRDRPANIALIEQFISKINTNLAKQVLVKIQVLEVTLDSAFSFGIDWSLVIKGFHNSPFAINANLGTPITITDARTSALGIDQSTTNNPDKTGIPGYKILLRQLSQQGKTSVVSEPRVVCLNNQVSVVRIIQNEGYVASIQNTSLPSGSTSGTASTVTSQVTPGMLTYGLTLYVLPKILNNKIFMQVNADLSTNNGFKVFPTSDNSAATNTQIQLPNITVKHFNQRSMIKSGDTLILSGFRQLTNRANANQFFTSQALGGKGAQMINTETIVLITPIILPGNA